MPILLSTAGYARSSRKSLTRRKEKESRSLNRENGPERQLGHEPASAQHTPGDHHEAHAQVCLKKNAHTQTHDAHAPLGHTQFQTYSAAATSQHDAYRSPEHDGAVEDSWGAGRWEWRVREWPKRTAAPSPRSQPAGRSVELHCPKKKMERKGKGPVKPMETGRGIGMFL